MSNYWEEKFAETGADGVDFVPLIAKPWDIKTIYDSRTKGEMLAELHILVQITSFGR